MSGYRLKGVELAVPDVLASFSEYKCVRFYFENKANKETFDNNPAQYGAMPTKEALFCPVTKTKIDIYGAASSLLDYEWIAQVRVRYYCCSSDCAKKLRADPAKYVGKAKEHVKTLGIATRAKD